MYMNQLTIIGFTGQDADFHYTPNGTAITTLSLATKESWKNDKDEWQSRTDWHRVLAFRKLAEYAKTLVKGSHLMVQGSLRSREYEKDGVKHRVFELRADAIAKLDRAERKEEQDSTFRMSPASRPRFENGWFGSADERPKWPGRSGQCDPARTGVRSQDVLSH